MSWVLDPDEGEPHGTALLVPGFTGSKEDFISVLPLLAADGWRVVTYDQRGQYESAGTPEPYTLAYVTLAEGPRMLTNIVDCDFDKLKIGMPVHVVFKPSKEGALVPVWAPD